MNAANIERAIVPLALLIGVPWAGTAAAAPISFKVALTGAQCVPRVETGGSGTADLTYDAATREVTWNVSYSGLSSPTTMAHFHGPAKPGQNGPVEIWLNKQGAPPPNPMTGKAALTPEQAKQFAAGEWYVNVHTQSHPACEIRGQVVLPKD